MRQAIRFPKSFPCLHDPDVFVLSERNGMATRASPSAGPR